MPRRVSIARIAGFFAIWLGVGLAYDLIMRFWVLPRDARATLAQPIRPLHLVDAPMKEALEQIVDTSAAPIYLSLCPSAASSRVTITTTADMPLSEVLLSLAHGVGATVDLMHSRHGLSEPFPHLYFEGRPCNSPSFVYVNSGKKERDRKERQGGP